MAGPPAYQMMLQPKRLRLANAHWPTGGDVLDGRLKFTAARAVAGA